MRVYAAAWQRQGFPSADRLTSSGCEHCRFTTPPWSVSGFDFSTHDNGSEMSYSSALTRAMKNKKQEAVELESELLRLTELVRARRKQLVKLRECPHSDCECRAVWKDHVDKSLADQVGKVRRRVTSKSAKSKSAKARAKK